MTINTYLGNGAGFGTAGLRGLTFGPQNAGVIQGNVARQAALEESLLGIQAQREARQQYALNSRAGLSPLQNQAQIFAQSPDQLVANQNLLSMLTNTAALTPLAQSAAAAGNNNPLAFLSAGAGGLFGQPNIGNFAGLGAGVTNGFAGQGQFDNQYFNQMMSQLFGNNAGYQNKQYGQSPQRKPNLTTIDSSNYTPPEALFGAGR